MYILGSSFIQLNYIESEIYRRRTCTLCYSSCRLVGMLLARLIKFKKLLEKEMQSKFENTIEFNIDN